LLASRSFAGITAATWVPLTILGSSYYRREDTVKAVGYLNAANGFGRMAALLVGGFVAQALGFSYAFLLGGVVGLVGLVLGFGMVEKSSKEITDTEVADTEIAPAVEPPSMATLLDVAKNPQLLCASILAILVMFIQFATSFGFTPMVANQMGANNIHLGLLGMVATIPALFISPFMGRAVQRFGLIAVLAMGFALSGLGTVLVAVCQNLMQLFLVQFVSSIGLSALMTVLMGLSIRDISSDCRATAMGFFQAVYGLGMFLGPFAIGWISHSFGLSVAFMFTGAVGLFGIILTVIFVKRGSLFG
jgi:MFS family permease